MICFIDFSGDNKNVLKNVVMDAMENGNIECYKLGDILDDLARKGYIQKGIYLIEMSW